MNGRGHKRWTREEDAQLQRLLTAGKDLADAAEVLGRSPKGCEGRARRLGECPSRRPCRPWTEAEIRRMCRLRQQGWTWPRIAKALGRTSQSLMKKHQELLDADRKIDPAVEAQALYAPWQQVLRAPRPWA